MEGRRVRVLKEVIRAAVGIRSQKEFGSFSGEVKIPKSCASPPAYGLLWRIVLRPSAKGSGVLSAY